MCKVAFFLTYCVVVYAIVVVGECVALGCKFFMVEIFVFCLSMADVN